MIDSQDFHLNIKAKVLICWTSKQVYVSDIIYQSKNLVQKARARMKKGTRIRTLTHVSYTRQLEPLGMKKWSNRRSHDKRNGASLDMWSEALVMGGGGNNHQGLYVGVRGAPDHFIVSVYRLQLVITWR